MPVPPGGVQENKALLTTRGTEDPETGRKRRAAETEVLLLASDRAWEGSGEALRVISALDSGVDGTGLNKGGFAGGNDDLLDMLNWRCMWPVQVWAREKRFGKWT